MSIWIRAKVRSLDIRQPSRLEARRLLERSESPELAIPPYVLLQTESADHLIVLVPYTCVPQGAKPLLRRIFIHSIRHSTRHKVTNLVAVSAGRRLCAAGRWGNSGRELRDRRDVI